MKLSVESSWSGQGQYWEGVGSAHKDRWIVNWNRTFVLMLGDSITRMGLHCSWSEEANLEVGFGTYCDWEGQKTRRGGLDGPGYEELIMEGLLTNGFLWNVGGSDRSTCGSSWGWSYVSHITGSPLKVAWHFSSHMLPIFPWPKPALAYHQKLSGQHPRH